MADTPETPWSTGRRIAVVLASIGLVLALVGIVGWQRGWFRRPEDPRVVEIGTMMRGMLEKERQRQGTANFLTAIERATGLMALGAKVAALPEELRPRVMPFAWGVVLDHLDDRMNAYFALRTAAERGKFIDNELAQMDFLKRAFESQGGKPGQGPRGPREGAREGAGEAPRGGPRGESADGSGQTREQRWIKWTLDRTTPEQRARLTEYIAAFERRMVQKGRKVP